MTHLTEDQLEDLLHTEMPTNVHLNSCELCQTRLKEKQALKTRLNAAFSKLTPPAELAESIRSQIALSSRESSSDVSLPTRKLPYHLKRWATPLSSIAAALLCVSLIKIVFVPEPAYADLVEIHKHNLSEGHDFLAETDPNALADYFRENLGFNPRLPELSHGLQLRGCCVKHFQGKVVGSYVVDTPQGYITVVAVEDEPASLGIITLSQNNGQTYYHTQFAKCDMVAVRIDDYTYCAIGEVSSTYLQSLLEKLLPVETDR